jgi:hypothetical protein
MMMVFYILLAIIISAIFVIIEKQIEKWLDRKVVDKTLIKKDEMDYLSINAINVEKQLIDANHEIDTYALELNNLRQDLESLKHSSATANNESALELENLRKDLASLKDSSVTTNDKYASELGNLRKDLASLKHSDVTTNDKYASELGNLRKDLASLKHRSAIANDKFALELENLRKDLASLKHGSITPNDKFASELENLQQDLANFKYIVETNITKKSFGTVRQSQRLSFVAPDFCNEDIAEASVPISTSKTAKWYDVFDTSEITPGKVKLHLLNSSDAVDQAYQYISKAQKNGGMAAYIGVQHILEADLAKSHGVNLRHLFIYECETMENMCEIAKYLIKSKIYDMISIVIHIDHDARANTMHASDSLMAAFSNLAEIADASKTAIVLFAYSRNLSESEDKSLWLDLYNNEDIDYPLEEQKAIHSYDDSTTE